MAWHDGANHNYNKVYIFLKKLQYINKLKDIDIKLFRLFRLMILFYLS